MKIACGCHKLPVKCETGIKEELTYYEALQEISLIADTNERKKLFEINQVISDTAMYGCNLFDHVCKP